MLPAIQDMSLPKGAPLDARVTVSPDLPLVAACFVFFGASGNELLRVNSAPAVVIEEMTNTIDLLLTGAQTVTLADGDVATYQLDVKTVDGSTPRILRGRAIATVGVLPTFPA